MDNTKLNVYFEPVAEKHKRVHSDGISAGGGRRTVSTSNHGKISLISTMNSTGICGTKVNDQLKTTYINTAGQRETNS